MEEIFLKRISYETDSIHVPLMMDTSMAVKGKMKRTIREQMEDLRDLRNKYPERILPFVSIDPNNPEAFQLFSDAFDSEKDFKFWGVKIYPCLGYLPSHPVLMKIFKICEECNIPIITHGSSVATKPKYKKSHIYGLELDRDGKIVPVDKYVKLRTKNDWKFFNDPKNWIPVLEAYPNLRLDLAHFGGDEFLKFGTLQRNWVVDIIDMLLSGKYPNLYTDFSYTLYDSRKYIKLKQLLLDNPKILDRVLFGTDFFMILLEGSFRVIRTNFITYMGEILMDKIGKTNNRKFLFP
jgi:predicted TIM-barrel fold metal-dependent hydrolase